MELTEEIHRHLPTYLNPEDRKNLFDEIKSFPSNIDSRIYSSHPSLSKDIIYQGDIIANQPFILLPENNLKNSQVLVISNTCDIDLSNNNIKSPRVVYCPIISFSNYKNLVYKSYEKEQSANDHLNSVRKQEITDMFYLPEHGDIKESIVLFDAANNYRMEPSQAKEMLENRITSLGNYGFMLFIVKLSIHFTRIEEGVNRG
ncbi:MAG TPA: hypothetical protein VE912_04305 [Bacteroidales bacterium]|nr:hypothetical protein [Bacteroidales bacterium]